MLQDDLGKEVKNIFVPKWETETATIIPSSEDLRLNSNHAKELKAAVVLYADLDGSTQMVDEHIWYYSAEVYKAYLRCASEIIRSEKGTIAAYDGDRVMAVYMGDSANTSAVRTALKINHAVKFIINPALHDVYKETGHDVKHVIGIDSSSLHAARIGVHGDNDIVWVGRAANHAAKLCMRSGHSIWITKAVYDVMNDVTKIAPAGENAWARDSWTEMNNMEIYSTDYWWTTIP